MSDTDAAVARNEVRAEAERRYPTRHYPNGESEAFAEGAEWQASRNKDEPEPSWLSALFPGTRDALDGLTIRKEGTP